MKPEELLFCETHEWAHISEEGGEKIATLGISAFAVEQLTDLVFMELPAVGTQVSAGGEFGEVESVKATSEIFTAVSGTITEVNVALGDHPELLNDDAFEVFHGGIESLFGYRYLLPGGRLAEHAHTEKERYEDHQIPEADHPSPDHVSPSPFVKSDHARSLLPAGTCLLL